MTIIYILIAIWFLGTAFGSMAEGPSKQSKRTKSLDPGSDRDFGGRL